MDFQNRVGSRTGGGGMAGQSETNVNRRKRLEMLAMETIDIKTDPYFMKNHLGSYECKLCLTLHTTEGSYLAHTQGKKHQTNLGRRAARDAKTSHSTLQPTVGPAAPTNKIINYVRIGRPGYQITKVQDPNTKQHGLLFQIHFINIEPDVTPLYRIMSAYEQNIETPDKNYRYLLVAARPYDIIAFKIPSKDIDDSEQNKMWDHFDPDSKQYSVQLLFRS